MKPVFRTTLRLMSAALAALLCGAAVCPVTALAAGQKELTVNDSETGTGMFRFEFSGAWVHEGGYPERFVGGDEHWTTANIFGTSYPSVTLRFIGTRAAVYGHKVSEGATASVTLDGQDRGKIDLYSVDRVEKVLIFDTGIIPDGAHTLTIRLLEEKNPHAGSTHEASIDYAVITTSETLPVTGIKPSVTSITLEPGMTYSLSYTLLPEYATETPVISLRSDNESVASVAADGTITAVGVGSAVVTLAPAEGDYSASVRVTVREPVGGLLVGMSGDPWAHTTQDAYDALFSGLKGSESRELSAVLWQNDTAACKLDLLTKGQTLTNVTASASPLTRADGQTLDGSVSLYFIKDVYAHDTGHMIPDVLYTRGAVTLPAASAASVWVKTETAPGALPGVYTGEITVTADGAEPVVFPLSVEVIGLAAPDAMPAFELWMYPYSSNRYYSGKTTAAYFGEGVEGCFRTHLDPAYEAGLRSQISLYKSAGGNCVTATIGEDPWNSQTPDPYPSMIKWTREKDGSFTFDYTDFDYWVELNESCGVTGNILCFSMSDWGNRVTYLDLRSGDVETQQLTPGSGAWKKVWGEFLTEFMAHTKEKGWFDRVYMAMDERPADVVEAVLDLVESVRDENGACFKSSLAVFTFDTEYLFDRVTDLALAYAMDPARVKEIAARRREAGLETTLYTCGAQNSALENQPIEGVYCMWYTAALGTDGFLRWALDAFNDSPLDSSAHRLFAAGDIFLIYPDDKDSPAMQAHSSARFEALAAGMRDVAKLNRLREIAPEYEKELDRALAAIGRSGNVRTDVTRAEDKLNDIARALAAARAEEETQPVTEPVTEPQTDPVTEAVTDPETTPASPESTAGETADTTGENGGTPDSGCSSAAAGAALALTAAAAVVVKKKKED